MATVRESQELRHQREKETGLLFMLLMSMIMRRTWAEAERVAARVMVLEH